MVKSCRNTSQIAIHFLMIDRITDVEPGQYAKGYKHLTNNEWYFPVHFPGGPNMPGALQLEAMAQMLTVAITTQDGLAGGVTHALEHTVRFKKEIIPGDTLIIEAYVDSWKRGICKGHATGYTDGEVACEAKMMITIPEILEQYLPKGLDGREFVMDFDAIIVGGGAAGAAVTWQLVSNGMKVACLERGPWMLPNEYPSTRHDWELQKLGAYSPVSAIRQSRYDYPIDDSESPVAVCNFNAVGGSTILYSGHYPRFRPNDFTLRSDHGLGEDWPISYEELRPFYEANETETGVAGLAGDPAYPDIEHLLPPVPLGEAQAIAWPKHSTALGGIGGQVMQPSQPWPATAVRHASILAHATPVAPRVPNQVQILPIWSGHVLWAPQSSPRLLLAVF